MRQVPALLFVDGDREDANAHAAIGVSGSVTRTVMQCRILLCILLLCSRAFGAEWEIFRHEGRDYIPVQNVARFYGLPEWPAPEFQLADHNKIVILDNGTRQIQVTLNSREAVINGARHWLSFPVYLVQERLVLSRMDLAKVLEPALRPAAIDPLTPVKTVVVDAGHGGHDKGAHSLFGYEKDFALDVAQRVKKGLELRNFRVRMTRASDVFIPLEKRPRVANNLPESIFVSIHFNSTGTNPLATGIEVFSCTPRGAPSTASANLTSRDLRNEPGNALDVPSAALACAVHTALLGNTRAVDRGLKRDRFAVIRLAKVPAILVECGFLSSATESRLIASTAWREKLAESIVTGIEAYRTLAEKKIPPKTLAEYQRAASEPAPLQPGGTAPQTASAGASPAPVNGSP
jgi:N-acetylmuramoyl-L-alanine amidase